MADAPVIVPIQLEVTDLDMSNVDMSDVQKSMTKKLTDLSKSVNNAMSAIGKSGQSNKAIDSSMSTVEKSVTRVLSAYDKYVNALNNAGKSSDEYKAKLAELEQAQNEASSIRSQREAFEDDNGNYIGTTGYTFEKYISICEEYEAVLGRVYDLQTELQNPSQFADSGSSDALDKVKTAYQGLVGAITDSNSKINTFNDTLSNNQYTNDYANKLKELEATQKKIDALSDKSQKMSATGASQGAWKNLRVDADLLGQKIVQIQADLTKMVQEGQAFRFGGDGNAEIDAVNSRVQKLLGSLGQIRTYGKSTPESVIKGFKKVDNVLTKIGKSIKSVISHMFKFKKSGTSTTNSLQKGFKKLLKNFMMFGLGFRSMYFLVKKLRTVFMEQFKYLAQGYPEANKVISEFMTSINKLKGSIVTAFEPLANVVLPVLTTFIGKLSQAMSALGRFFATLTGQGYIYEFTSDNIDAAESMKETASAAKKAQKALMGFDELNRIDVDSDSGSGGADTGAQGTWNKVDIEGATSSLAEMIKKCWEQEDFTELGVYLGERLKVGLDTATSVIEGQILTTGTKIANALATTINGYVSVDGLANTIGGIVGAAINTAMSILDTFFVTTKWLDVGKFIADTINGFVTKTDFSLIGKTVGDLVLAAINLFWSTVTNIDFTNIGNKISEGINNVFATLGETDITGLSGWQKLGQGISNAVTGLLELMITALQNTDWQQVGIAVGESIGSIDWRQITWDLTEFVASFISGLCQAFMSWADTDPLSAAISSLIGLAVVNIKAIPTILKVAPKLIGFFGKLGEVVALVAGGAGTLHEALVVMFGTAATTIAGVMSLVAGIAMAITNFFSMLKNGFSWLKEILMVIGIALAAVGAVILGAPATVAAVVAAIVAAVMTAIVLIKEHWSEIVQFFKDLWEDAKTVVIEEWNNIKEAISTAWENIKTGVSDAINAVKTTIINVVTAISTWWTTTWENIKATTIEIFENIKTTITNVITTVKDTITNVVTAIKVWWTETWEKIKTNTTKIWESIKTFISETITKVKETITNVVESIKIWLAETWENIKTTVINVFTSIKETISNTLENIKTFWTESWNKIKETTTGVWDKIKTTVSNAVTGVKDTIARVIDTIKTKWETVWGNIKDNFISIWDGIKNAIKNSINGIIGFVNKMMSAVAKGINTVTGALNKLSFNVPSWVPGIGGNTWGFKIPAISAPQIPYLAQGAVIPPNREFMAVLGDQKQGTNIEAPANLIKQMAKEGMLEASAMMNNKDFTVRVESPIYLDGRQIALAVREAENKLGSQTVFGGFANAY